MQHDGSFSVGVFDAMNTLLTIFSGLARQYRRGREDRRANRQDYRQIANELSMYTDHELCELRLSRVDIHAVASGTDRPRRKNDGGLASGVPGDRVA